MIVILSEYFYDFCALISITVNMDRYNYINKNPLGL